MRFPLILLLLMVSGCASSGDVDFLRRDISDLQRSVLEQKKEVEALREKTGVMVREDSFTAVRENQAEINSRIAELNSGLQELRGRFEENKFGVDKALRDMVSERDMLRAQVGALESQVKTMKDKLAALEGQRPKESAGETAAKQPDEAPAEAKQDEGKKAAEEADTPDGGQKAYEAAYQDFKDKKYRSAREKFETFLKDYPKHGLAGNAQFWIAETYYAEKDYEGAILAYESLFKKHPSSEKTGGALLKQGLAFIEIGDKKTAKTILTRVVERFPGSPEAATAKKKLAELEKKPSKKK